MKPPIVQAVKAFIVRRITQLDALSVEWFGGEPLLAKPVIVDIAEHIRSSLSSFPAVMYSGSLTTNGYFLDGATASALTGLGIRSFQISLDGPPDVHDQSRVRTDGSGTCSDIWHTLLTMYDSDLTFEVMLRLHFTPATASRLYELIDLINESFADDVRFKVAFKAVSRLGGENDHMLELFRPDVEQDTIAAFQGHLRRRAEPTAPDGPSPRITRPTKRLDVSPAFSSDGRRMAFIRETGPAINAIYVLPLSPDLTPAGAPLRVVSNTRSGVLGLAWTPDDSGLVFAAGGHLGPSRIHRVALSSETSTPLGAPVMLPFGEQANAISIARTGRMVYSTQFRDTDLRKLGLTNPARGPEVPALGGSTFDEETPDYSPDGARLAFASTRSGTEEIWISNADGSSPRQMTFTGGATCANPQWSPDGQTILYNSRAEGSSDLYLLRWATGEVRRLTSDPLDEAEARWSRDGHSIYYGSNATGRLEVWKLPAQGRPAHAGHARRRRGRERVSRWAIPVLRQAGGVPYLDLADAGLGWRGNTGGRRAELLAQLRGG